TRCLSDWSSDVCSSDLIGLNTISYVILIVMLVLVKLDPQQRRAPQTAERPRLRDSVRMVAKTPHLVVLLAAVMAASLAMDPVTRSEERRVGKEWSTQRA